MGVVDFKQHWQAIKNRVNGTLGPDAKPLEIRAAVVDAIEDRVEAVGRGRRTFPYNRVAIRVLMPTKQDKPALEAVFAELDARVRERLDEIRCDRPAAIEYSLSFVSKAPANWSEGMLFSIDCQRRDRPEPEAPPAPPLTTPALRVQVLTGAATRKTYAFTESIVFVGRTIEAKDAAGRRRRNHVAFEDGNATVSRAHARFKYDAPRRCYHLLDDGSVHGTVVIRGGETLEVPKRDPRGVLIQSGDEIQFGDAMVRVTIG